MYNRSSLPKMQKSPLILDPATLIPILFLSVTIPTLALQRDFSSGYSTGEVNFTFAALSYLTMFFLAVLSYIKSKARRIPLYYSDISLTILLLFIYIQSIYMESILIFLQLGLFIVVVVSFRTATQSPRIKTAIRTTSYALIFFATFCFLIYGTPTDRWVGGIHPNIFGAVLVAAASFSLFQKPIVRDAIFLIALIAAVLVSSRYAILSIVLIYMVYWMLNFRKINWLRLAILLFCVAALLIDFLYRAETGMVARFLLLNDPLRGVGSGVSGRDDNWSMFMPQLMDRPFFGYGYRNKLAYFYPHNGFLDLILQLGIVGSALFFYIVLDRLIELFREALSHPNVKDRGKILSIFIGTIVASQFQPQFISFGDAFGITTLFCIFATKGFEYRVES